MNKNFMMSDEFDRLAKESVRREIEKMKKQGIEPGYVETKPEPEIPVVVVISRSKKL